jgi:hypothetical protein
MTGQLDRAAAMMRAAGIIRAFHAADDDHMEAVVRNAQAEDLLDTTVAALVAIGALLAGELAEVRGVSVEEVLGDTLRF